LTGRDRELQRVADALADPACRGAVIIGEPGVGKSRLAREVAEMAAAQDMYVEWLQATRSAATVPLGAVTDLVPDAVRSDDVAALMRGAATTMRGRAAGRRALVCVDDAQLLDPA
jgi:predicted ATPase